MRTFQDVLNEVTAQSDPQRNAVLGQISQLPAQQTADEAALGAKKDQAYQDITDAARRRGLGFSGIPLGEQAKYAATDYAPALANLKSNYSNRQATLQSALADIGKSDYTTAYDIFNQERNYELQKQQAAAQSAQAAVPSPLASLFGSMQQQQQPQQQIDPVKNKAQADVANLLTKDANRISREYLAIKKSAGYGNAYDKLKLQLLEYYHPELKSTGSNTVPLGRANPTLVSLNPVNQSGLSVGVAQPGRLTF